MSIEDIKKQGWSKPFLAKKYHYFKRGEGTSVCGKWLFVGEREDDMHEHGENCAKCKRIVLGTLGKKS